MATAKVNASTTKVGHEEMGGNWELDVMALPKVPFNAEARSEFRQVLATIYYDGSKNGTAYSGTVGDGSQSKPYTLDQASTMMAIAGIGGSSKPISIVAGTLTISATQAASKYINGAGILEITGTTLTNTTSLTNVSVTGGG